MKRGTLLDDIHALTSFGGGMDGDDDHFEDGTSALDAVNAGATGIWKEERHGSDANAGARGGAARPSQLRKDTGMDFDDDVRYKGKKVSRKALRGMMDDSDEDDAEGEHGGEDYEEEEDEEDVDGSQEDDDEDDDDDDEEEEEEGEEESDASPQQNDHYKGSLGSDDDGDEGEDSSEEEEEEDSSEEEEDGSDLEQEMKRIREDKQGMSVLLKRSRGKSS